LGGLQRYAMDYVYSKGVDIFLAAKTSGKKIAVVGAGPAGLLAQESWRGKGTM